MRKYCVCMLVEYIYIYIYIYKKKTKKSMMMLYLLSEEKLDILKFFYIKYLKKTLQILGFVLI